MQSRLAHRLTSVIAAAMLVTGVAATGTASAAPRSSSGVTSSHPVSVKKCYHVKGHWRTIKIHGKTRRVWIKPHTVCTKK